MTENNEHSQIKAARKAANLTQVQLAEKMGCSQQDVHRWEKGKVSPNIKTLYRIAEAIGCDVSKLL